MSHFYHAHPYLWTAGCLLAGFIAAAVIGLMAIAKLIGYLVSPWTRR